MEDIILGGKKKLNEIFVMRMFNKSWKKIINNTIDGWHFA
jgi:hypothetical protein